MSDPPKTIEELLSECSHEYTREEYVADRARLLARLCEKHGLTTVAEVEDLIRRHAYVHTEEDPEDEWIQITAFARAAGW